MQGIWQLQVAGCLAHCQGTSQTQLAQQTISAPAPATPATVGTSAKPAASVAITQLQVGCQTHCFASPPGAGTDSDAPQNAPGSAAVAPPLPELLSLLPGFSLPAPSPAPAPAPVVRQQSAQSQTGGPDTASQAQSARQTAELTGGSAAAAQAIWQLQIGCLSDCAGTVQRQTAAELSSAVDTSAGSLIWQVQVGCLEWCWAVTQVQIATVGPLPSPAAAGDGSGGATTSGGSPGATPPDVPAGPAGSAGTVAGAGAGTGTGASPSATDPASTVREGTIASGSASLISAPETRRISAVTAPTVLRTALPPVPVVAPNASSTVARDTTSVGATTPLGPTIAGAAPLAATATRGEARTRAKKRHGRVTQHARLPRLSSSLPVLAAGSRLSLNALMGDGGDAIPVIAVLVGGLLLVATGWGIWHGAKGVL